MSKKPKDATSDKNWYKDRYQHVLVQRKLLTLFTLVSMIGTLFTVLVIAKLAPLKTVEPFVIQVDQKSGITQTVDPQTVWELTANQAVNEFFIVQYIRARESYNIVDLARNYNIVRVMSSPSVYPAFVAQADPNNPLSNTARLGNGGIRTIKFKSITYLKPQLLQVRLLIEEKGGSNYQSHKIVLLGFEYVKMSLTMEDRYVNPLGFRVTEYSVVDDILPR